MYIFLYDMWGTKFKSKLWQNPTKKRDDLEDDLSHEEEKGSWEVSKG
jgi:hypothetical protein